MARADLLHPRSRGQFAATGQPRPIPERRGLRDPGMRRFDRQAAHAEVNGTMMTGPAAMLLSGHCQFIRQP